MNRKSRLDGVGISLSGSVDMGLNRKSRLDGDGISLSGSVAM